MILRFLIVFALALWLAACGGGEPDGDLLSASNRVRASGVACGPPAPELVRDSRLDAAALAHALDLHARQDPMSGISSHYGTNGSTPTQRAAIAGWQGRVGENLARGSWAAPGVVGAWVNSPGHCANLMDPQHTHMGYAQVGPYWVQVLASE